MGRPKAALFTWAPAATAYNILVVMRAALAAAPARAAARRRQAEAVLSSYYMAQGVAAATARMLVAAPRESRDRLPRLSLKQFAGRLIAAAAAAKLWRYRKSPRSARKATTVRRNQRGAHRSTARRLAEKDQK